MSDDNHAVHLSIGSRPIVSKPSAEKRASDVSGSPLDVRDGLRRLRATGHNGQIISAKNVILGITDEGKPLTDREQEVLDAIMNGNSNKQGALLLKISYRTFESHRARIMRKMGVDNIVGLVRKVLADQSSRESFCSLTASSSQECCDQPLPRK